MSDLGNKSRLESLAQNARLSVREETHKRKCIERRADSEKQLRLFMSNFVVPEALEMSGGDFFNLNDEDVYYAYAFDDQLEVQYHSTTVSQKIQIFVMEHNPNGDGILGSASTFCSATDLQDMSSEERFAYLAKLILETAIEARRDTIRRRENAQIDLEDKRVNDPLSTREEVALRYYLNKVNTNPMLPVEHLLSEAMKFADNFLNHMRRT